MPEVIAGKYEVLQTIGRGGMGTVYKATQRNLDRIVAIKMLSEELASDPEFRARFQQEATVVARLSHPNIVAVYDIEQHNHTFCIIMEYLEGENLQAKIDRDVTLGERDIVLIGAQVARALGYAHSQGIIHRDIKPDNIHVTPKGVAKVMDFGIARFLDSKLKTQTGISMGTPKFMSPEQVTGKNVDGQTDLYSLGVCLYYCLAGRPPFDGENAIAVATRHLYEQPELPSRYNTSISPAVEKVIMRALEKQKAERYTTGFDMADALEGTLGIKTPIRIAEDANAEVYAGATQRMELQAMAGGGATTFDVTEPMEVTPGGSINSGSGLRPRDHSPRGPGWSNVTPVPVRLVSDGLEQFTAPASATTPNPTQPEATSGGFRRWWPVLIAVSLLGAGAAYLAFGRSSTVPPTQNSGGVITQPNTAKRYEDLERETLALVQEHRYADAHRKWVDFKAAHPDFEKAAVDRRLDDLTAMLPVSEKAKLAKRRENKGLALIGNEDTEAAGMVYLQAALEMDPLSKVASLNLKTVEPRVTSKVEKRSEAERQTAHQAADRGRKLGSSGTGANTAEAEQAFLQAVNLEPENGTNWLAFGQFYAAQRRIDDARVMYWAASQRGPADVKREAENQLRALNQ